MKLTQDQLIAKAYESGLMANVILARDGVETNYAECLAKFAELLTNSDGYAETVRKCADIASNTFTKETAAYEAAGKVIAEEILALLTDTAAPTPDGAKQIPDGYKVVLKQPAPEQCSAFFEAMHKCGIPHSKNDLTQADFELIYHDVIAASPAIEGK